MRLKHIVMWKFKENADELTPSEIACIMKSRLEALPEFIPQIQSIEVGVNILESETAFDAVLIAIFNSKADLETYKQHPMHKEISAFCRSVRKERVVCDYYID